MIITQIYNMNQYYTNLSISHILLNPVLKL